MPKIITTKKNIYSSVSKKSKKQEGINKYKLKAELKSIYDVGELNNLPEFNYNYDLVYFKSLFDSLSFTDNKLHIIPFRFKYNTLSNENVLKIREYYYNKFINLGILKKINELFNYFDLSKYFKNYKLIATITHMIYKKNMNNKKTTLFILSSYNDTINTENMELVLLKNQVINTDVEYNFFKAKYPNIIDGQSLEKLENYFNSRKNKKFDNIIIEYYNINYNIFIYPLIFIIKLPLFIYLVCNALKLLKTGGYLIIDITIFNISIPSVLKIFSLLINLFEDVFIINESSITSSKLFKFTKFKGFSEIYNKNLIDELIKIGKIHMNKIFSIDDIIESLKSNKLFYKLDSELIKTLHTNTKAKKDKKILNDKILYDIPELMFSAIDINQGYKIINLINNAFRTQLYVRNYFINKYMNDTNSLLDYFKFNYINYYETIIINKLQISLENKDILNSIFNSFVEKINELTNKIYTLNNRHSNIYANIYSNIDTHTNYKCKLLNNFNIYYYQLLLLKRADCNILNRLSSRLNNILINHIDNTYNKKDINISQFISLYEILTIYKPVFSKYIINTLIINYNMINTGLLEVLHLMYPWFALNIQKNSTIITKTTFEKEFEHNIRYLDEISINNTLQAIKEYKKLGYTLIIPYINTNICNITEYYNQEVLQLLYVLGASSKHTNSITQHKLILDDIHTLEDIDKIYFLIDIIYIYSLLYKTIKIHKPYNTNNDTTFFIVGIDYLNNEDNDKNLLEKLIKVYNNPNTNKIITVPEAKQNEIMKIFIDIIIECNNWRFNAYKLCMCKKIKNINCYNLESGSNVKIPGYFNNPLKLL